VSEDIDWTRKPVIGKVEAVDADLDLNALLYYSIIGKICLILASLFSPRTKIM
jgi:hypothetical protein